jgi:uncharacterized membrane protein
MLRLAFAFAVVAWALALPVATWIASHSLHLSIPYTAAFAIYAIGSWVCHQRPDRSFHLWAMQMPVCARCTGIYLGGALAAAAAWIALRRGAAGAWSNSWSTRQWRMAFAFAALPTLATLAAGWIGGTATSNAARAIAGLPLGAAVAWVVLRAEVN